MSEHAIGLEGPHVVATLKLERAEALGHRQADPAQFERWLDDRLREVRRGVLATLDALTAEGEVGTVKWFDEAKGFGFITISSVDEVFVHWKGIKGEGYRTLKSGDRVRFLRREGRDHGFEAFDVERLHKGEA